MFLLKLSDVTIVLPYHLNAIFDICVVFKLFLRNVYIFCIVQMVRLKDSRSESITFKKIFYVPSTERFHILDNVRQGF